MTDNIAIQSLIYSAREGLRRVQELSSRVENNDRHRENNLAALGVECDALSAVLVKLGAFANELPDEVTEEGKRQGPPKVDRELIPAAKALQAITRGVMRRCSECGGWEIGGEGKALETDEPARVPDHVREAARRNLDEDN